jgi:hypothetical protein
MTELKTLKDFRDCTDKEFFDQYEKVSDHLQKLCDKEFFDQYDKVSDHLQKLCKNRKEFMDLLSDIDELINWSDHDDLIKEAIKWVKFIETQTGGDWVNDPYCCKPTLLHWIKHFFNLTEQDLTKTKLNKIGEKSKWKKRNLQE